MPCKLLNKEKKAGVDMKMGENKGAAAWRIIQKK
jgi:hypothetical protein